MAEWEIEAGRCPHCGGMTEDCSRAEQDYYPTVRICYSTMARAAWKRAWDAKHETSDQKPMWHDGTFQRWSDRYSDDFPFHRDDGVTVAVAAHDDGSWDALTAGAAGDPAERQSAPRLDADDRQ